MFVVKGGRLATPPVDAGILAGITRAHVLDAATAAGVPVDERTLRPEDLYAADEVFVTSSIRELLPVVRVDGRTIGAGVPGPVARALHRAFRVTAGLGERPDALGARAAARRSDQRALAIASISTSAPRG